MSQPTVVMDAGAEAMETDRLLALYKETGDEQLKWEIVLRYEELVKRAAAQVRGIYAGFAQTEDIINEGLITLARSIEKFDPDKGVKFETYVAKRIRGMIVDLARKQDWLPRNARKRARELDEATTELYSQLGRYPTSAEMAAYLEISEEKYKKEAASVAMNGMLSLDALMDLRETGGSMSFQFASQDESVLPEAVIEEEELRQALTDAIAALQPNEQIVLSLYYVENLHLKEIAQIMGLSEPRISQLHTRSIKKLRSSLMAYYDMTDPAQKPAERGKKG